MRLVSEAQQLDESAWPDELKAVSLSPEDQTLSAEDKMTLGQELVCDSNYQTARTEITDQVSECMSSLIQQTNNQQGHAVSVFSDMYRKLEIGILLLVVLMLVICIMVRRLIVVPLMHCKEHIVQDLTFPLEGVEELQVLAETYNKIYQENQEAQLLIQHKAEHDPLTDLLNRGSFEKLLKLYSRGEAPFALIIVDVDFFKTVNDTCGHAVGDETLKRIAALLQSTFRSVDYVCRIGGDEFAVIMVEMTSDLKYPIQEKIDAINQILAQQQDPALPKVSLSVGVAFSDRPNPTGTLFEDADHALYQRKKHGKAGCTFYE